MWGITKPGFTLIELLITISLVAIVSAIGMNSFIGSQKRSRDFRRQSDLNQYRVALENYSSVNAGVYPALAQNGNAGATSGAGSGIFSSSTGALINYMTGWPTDPKPGAGGYDYYYRADAAGTNWVLQGCMEAGASNAKVYEICSSGKSGIWSGPSICSTNPDSGCDLP